MANGKLNGPQTLDVTSSTTDYQLGDGPKLVTVNLAILGDTITLGNGPAAITLGREDHNNTLTAGNGPKTVTIGTGSNTNQITLGDGPALVTDNGFANAISIGNGPATVTGGQGDTISLGAGNHSVDVLNDIITVGAGRDSFVFDRVNPHSPHTNFSTITGFDPTHDTIDISKSVFGVSSFAQLEKSQNGSDTVITNGGSHPSLKITLRDVQETALSAHDFKFT